MIELRTLGVLELRAPGGDELGQVLAQPKRLALLVYLAVARGGGFHRRDTLFALFWPESDAERARSSLRTALHFLRRSLGTGAIAGRGADEVGLAPGALRCDAAAFEAELDSGRPAAALELYRGPFLAGFNLSGTGGWERWLDEERDRLRRRAVDAAWSLAGAAEEAADADGAARWGRRALAVSEDDESALRRLMQLLARVGRPAEAVHACEAFARRLDGDEPSRRTLALLAEIRAALEAEPVIPSVVRPPVAAPPADPPPPLDVQPAVPAPVTPPAVPRRPGRMRWVAGLALAGAAIVGLWSARGSPAEPADGATRHVAVLPFTVYGRGELAYLREGMVDLLSAKLDGAGELRAVDARALLASLDGAAPTAPAGADEAAEEVGADLFVLGSVVQAGRELQLRAVLYRRSDDGPAAEADAVVAGGADSLPHLVDRLTAELVAKRLKGPRARLTRTAVLTTPSVPALKAYLQGESAMRAGHADEAVEALGRAVAADSTFALAWYRLSVAVANAGPRTGEAARQAVRYAGRLAPYDRLLLQAWLAAWDFRYAEAERMYREAVATHPDDVEAWSHLATVLFHGGPQRGNPAAESRPAWERVLALEPDNVEATGYLARIAVVEGRRADADALLRRALALNPDGDRALVWRAYRGILLGDAAAMEGAVAGLRRANDIRLWVIVSRLLEETQDPARARPLVELLLDPLRPPRLRASGHVVLAHGEVARGRWRAARSELDAAELIDRDVALQARILFATLPFVPVDTAEVAAVRARVLARESGLADAPPGPPLSGPHAGVPAPELRLHALGLIEARLGNREAALEYARRLDRVGARSPGVRIRGPLLADGVRAHVAWIGGEPAAGLAVIDSAWQELDRKPEVYPYLLDAGHPRFLRAELLRMAGRDREALAWYGSVLEHFDKGVVYAAPVHLRRAALLERAGRPREAAAHYARFVALWAECDPALRPQLDHARKRLQSLQSP